MRYLLSIGSNCPDGEERLQQAGEWLRANFADVETSAIFTSKALNGKSADYFNMVATIGSELTVNELTEITKGYETACGRTPESKSRGMVEMDIDIVAADRTILRPDEYTRGYFIRGLSLLNAAAT